MIRKIYFRDGTEQITYSLEETKEVVLNSEKDIDHMEKIEGDDEALEEAPYRFTSKQQKTGKKKTN